MGEDRSDADRTTRKPRRATRIAARARARTASGAESEDHADEHGRGEAADAAGEDRPAPPPKRRGLRRDGRRLRDGRCRDGRRAAAPRTTANEPRGPDYRPFVTKFDETVAAEDLCEPEELDRLRGYLDKQLSHLQGVVARLANRLQRRLMAQQNRAWEFDLEEGMLDPARLSRIVVDPLHPLSFKHEKDTDLPRHGGDAAARQFRLDARPADHGGGDLRRHPGAHAGALRRQGRDPRLHHPRLEGRAVARGWLAAGKPPIPAASTICATSSTSRPMRPGGARARISA